MKASYIPSREQREVRELSRYRRSLIGERARELKRLQKMLEGGNIKLSSVVANINGCSAQKLLKAMLQSDAPICEEDVVHMIHGSMRYKINAIMIALDGVLIPLQKQLILNVVLSYR